MAHFEHIFLNRALANLDSQLQQLAADAFCSPQLVFTGHLLDQLDGFW